MKCGQFVISFSLQASGVFKTRFSLMAFALVLRNICRCAKLLHCTCRQTLKCRMNNSACHRQSANFYCSWQALSAKKNTRTGAAGLPNNLKQFANCQLLNWSSQQTKWCPNPTYRKSFGGECIALLFLWNG